MKRKLMDIGLNLGMNLPATGAQQQEEAADVSDASLPGTSM